MAENNLSGNQDNTEGEVSQFLGHPTGLFYLFFAELWERFSFYGMRALLNLYMIQQLFLDIISDETERKAYSYAVYAAYGALVYATPYLGGILADRFLGFRKAITLGGALMALGHFVLAFETEWAFYGGLALIIAGNGFFKPNISTFVGTLYKENDPRRDAGFNIFYMGINLGAWLAPLLTGWLAVKYGWHYGFGAAGIGMVLGLILFEIGKKGKTFGNNGHAPANAKKNHDMLIYVGSLVVVPLFAWLLSQADVVEVLLFASLAIALLIIGYNMYKGDKVVRGRLGSAIILTFFMAMFWAFFEQGGSSLTVYAAENVNLKMLNAAQTNSINPFFIVVFAMIFSWLWTYLAKRKRNPITPVKYGLGLAQLALGFFIFAWASQYVSPEGLVPMAFLVFGYLFISTGELFLSPVGLSKITELSPKKMSGFMMGFWFLAASFGHYLAGIIATFTAGSKSEDGEEKSILFEGLIELITGLNQESVANANEKVQNLFVYQVVYVQVGVVALGLGVIALLLAGPMKKWMHGVK